MHPYATNQREDITEGGAEVKVQLASFADESIVTDCNVKDLDNGRYEISICAGVVDISQLRINIDDVVIGSSPYIVNPKNYKDTKSSLSEYITGIRAARFITIGYSNTLYCATTIKGVAVSNYCTTTVGISVFSSSGEKKIEVSNSEIGVDEVRGIAVDEHSNIGAKTKVVTTNLDSQVIPSVAIDDRFNTIMGLCLSGDKLLLVGDFHNRNVHMFFVMTSLALPPLCIRGRVWGNLLYFTRTSWNVVRSTRQRNVV